MAPWTIGDLQPKHIFALPPAYLAEAQALHIGAHVDGWGHEDASFANLYNLNIDFIIL
jgi:hypothetical protein